MKTKAIILAWGNRGRRDDGAALVLAERLAHRFRTGGHVEVREYHQLAPEVADDLIGRDVAVFVDAHVRADRPAVFAERVIPDVSDSLDSHHCSPGKLLAIMHALGWAPPKRNWLVGIPAHDTTFGDYLSGVTAQAVEVAEHKVLSLLGGDPRHSNQSRKPCPSVQSSTTSLPT